MPRRNLLTLFNDFARFAGDLAVVQTRGYRREKLTYAELSVHASLWSSALGGRGIGPGDRVLLWGPNSAEWVACFWGILLRGAVVVPMDATASPDFVQRAIEDAGEYLKVYNLVGSRWHELGKMTGRGNGLFRNNHDGTFADLSGSHTNRAGWSWGVAFFDYDNDTNLDIYAANGWISNAPNTDL